MNTKKGHKLFALIMLILIVASVVATAVVTAYNVYDFKKQQEETITAV